MIRSRRKQGAFTLLEMIVVLLVVSFIGTLLMQGLSYASKANQSLHQSLGRGQVRALTFDWFRDAVENLVAPEAGEVRWRLRGDELSFEAMSAATLDRRAGIPTPLAFRLERRAGEDRTELIYVRRLEDSRWPLLHLRGEARFRYLDGHGQWHRDWPPSAQLADTLPEAMALAAPEERLFVLVAVALPRARPAEHDF
ncbi:type II secretion system protein J [Pseudomonas aeruginosa]|uniref:PulJ/GspJ family protein n=1 Tax=Pseudomonas aeruginosa TaxID=287 RepID=UPI0007724615|nr:type II secretion system protein [Pseudomonas aeruginosa]KXC72594.1 type II secretion system protein [Pseudomonas aeruginosa]KXC73275.1 type II secretion system protein [Pseudomonas aeruginosa]